MVLSKMGKQPRLEFNKMSRREFLRGSLRVLAGFAFGLLAFSNGCNSTSKPTFKTPPVLPESEGAAPQIGSNETATAEAITTTTDQTKFTDLVPSSSVEAPIIVADNQSSVSLNNYRLRVDGLVSNPLAIDYQSLMAYPSTAANVTLSCPGVFDLHSEWTGVPVSTILEQAGCSAEATQLTFYSLAGYNMQFSLQDIESRGIFLAYKVDGQILPPETGFPLRLVVPDSIGSYWVKWVDHIKVA
jgi:DMSO/TMAO reductase YedYZ molybdopterin-dependent catalytic subunit